MKILSSFLALGCIQALDSTLLMLMMQQQSVSNPNQANQMSHLLPLLMLSDSDSNKTSDNSDMLILMMMQGQGGDMNAVLPFLLLDDDSLDFKTLFLLTNMMRQGRHTVYDSS